MPILTIIIVIVAVGVILWALTTFLPMEPNVKRILVAAVVLCLVFWLCSAFGILDTLSTVRVGRAHR